MAVAVLLIQSYRLEVAKSYVFTLKNMWILVVIGWNIYYNQGGLSKYIPERVHTNADSP